MRKPSIIPAAVIFCPSLLMPPIDAAHAALEGARSRLATTGRPLRPAG